MLNNHKNLDESNKRVFNSKVLIAYFAGLFIAFMIYNNFYKKETITNAPVTFIQA